MKIGRSLTVCFSDLLWCALGDDLAAIDASFWSELDDPVRDLKNIDIMFNDDQGMSGINQGLQHSYESLYVRSM